MLLKKKLNRLYEIIYNKIHNKTIMINNIKYNIKDNSDNDLFCEMLILYSIRNIKNKHYRYNTFLLYIDLYLYSFNDSSPKNIYKIKYTDDINYKLSEIFLYKNSELYIDDIKDICIEMIYYIQQNLI